MAGKKKAKSEPKGAPMWMTTFADLMTLLMCFFVIIVSFSTTDQRRYLQLAGSMKSAFGMDSGVTENHIPAGFHAVMEFLGPGQSNGLTSSKTFEPESDKQTDRQGFAVGDPSQHAQAMSQDAQKLREMMEEELEDGAVQIEAMDDRIVIRVEDSAAFRSGSAELSADFLGLLTRLGPTLLVMPGSIAVAGHTDDRPIKTRRFRSNWDLSTARASSVVDALIDRGLEPARLVAQGYADSRPLLPNDSDEGRQSNRRVEITIVRPVERMTPP